jgi:hypothetical protein
MILKIFAAFAALVVGLIAMVVALATGPQLAAAAGLW